MLKKILETIGTRYLIAFLNLVLLFINAKVLGKEGVGIVGLIIASANIAVMINSILCGNTIVYFLNKYSFRTVFYPAYIWTICGSSLACGCMALTGLLPIGYLLDIYLLSILMSLVAANTRLLLGKEHISGFNLTFSLQGGLLFVFLLYFYYVAQKRNVEAYVEGLFLANGIAFIVSIFLLLPSILKSEKNQINKKKGAILKEMFVYGLWSGADNLAEVFTTRLNYFMVQHFGGLGSVGLLDAGTRMSESVWHISRSIAYIEYSSIAKEKNANQQKKTTLQLFKCTFIATFIVIGCIILIPEWVYTDILFSHEFTGIRKVIIFLSPGILALGCNSILSHFFIGTGRIKYSTICSCLGLSVLLLFGLILIPYYDVCGSAIATSIAFSSMLTFSLIIFIKQTNTHWKEFIPSQSDWILLKSKLIKTKK